MSDLADAPHSVSADTAGMSTSRGELKGTRSMSINARTHPQAVNTASHPGQAAGRSRWGARATVANIAVVLAVIFALSGTGAAATAYVISSNSQVGPATIAGHHNPVGDQANIIAGSINGADIQTGSIGSAQLAAPEPWHAVAPNPNNLGPNDTGVDPCTKGAIATFCGAGDPSTNPHQCCVKGYWANIDLPFAPGGFYRDPQSRVHLRGLVSWTFAGMYATSVPIFYLPVGYRPGHELVFATLDNSSAASYLVRVDVDPSGAVHVVNDPQATNWNYGGAFLSIDGISFRAGE
jgi:hypothetical protein